MTCMLCATTAAPCTGGTTQVRSAGGRAHVAPRLPRAEERGAPSFAGAAAAAGRPGARHADSSPAHSAPGSLGSREAPASPVFGVTVEHFAGSSQCLGRAFRSCVKVKFALSVLKPPRPSHDIWRLKRWQVRRQHGGLGLTGPWQSAKQHLLLEPSLSVRGGGGECVPVFA